MSNKSIRKAAIAGLASIILALGANDCKGGWGNPTYLRPKETNKEPYEKQDPVGRAIALGYLSLMSYLMYRVIARSGNTPWDKLNEDYDNLFKEIERERKEKGKGEEK